MVKRKEKIHLHEAHFQTLTGIASKIITLSVLVYSENVHTTWWKKVGKSLDGGWRGSCHTDQASSFCPHRWCCMRQDFACCTRCSPSVLNLPAQWIPDVLNYPVHFSGIGELGEAPGSVMCCKYICRIYGCCCRGDSVPSAHLAHSVLGSIGWCRAGTQLLKRMIPFLRSSPTSCWRSCYGPITVLLQLGCGGTYHRCIRDWRDSVRWKRIRALDPLVAGAELAIK